jgi:anti-sigma regulatory factor (Ser/Thr protein kinase)/putative methionine-R-sulfoxide reductase with GAF domain
MATEEKSMEAGRPRLGAGQTVLEPGGPILAPTEELRTLYQLSDPGLSELGLEELLDELLDRVRDALDVDTVALLLLDRDANELVARAARGIEEEVEQGVRIPLGNGFAGRIAAERVAIFIGDVDHADILNPILRQKGIRSLLGVPLIVEGDLIGVLHVGSLTARTFTQRDLAVLELAAARAAPGIERARLYSELAHERAVAVMLQRNLLPGRLPEVIGVEAAARYLPARAAVGGDWYDVIELPRGLLGIAIGDVVGHGVRAAALMGRLRTALHSYALEGIGPGRTLELVDRFVASIGDDAMATAAYGVFDPGSGKLALATAGHLPPVLISGGTSATIEVTPAAPLGAFPYSRYPERELVISAGDVLMLYTDGLIERRGVPLTDGIGQLLEVVRDARSAEDACARAMARLVPDEGLDDDVAVVAVESTTVPDELRLELPATPAVLSRTRHMLRRWLRAKGADDVTAAEVVLAVNEACANAIEHAYPPGPASFELSAGEAAGELTIMVRDSGRWRESRDPAQERGARIMSAAMTDVHVNRTDAGTTVLMHRTLSSR